MNKKHIFAFLIPITVTITMISIFAFGGGITLLDPKGFIAFKERQLIGFTATLALIIIAPVLLVMLYTVYKYREGNNKENYTPDSKSSIKKQLVWWIIPSILISLLAVVTWINTHSLDPYKPLASTKEPITIQVVALRWKWLFIYPKQNIATVNFIEIPVDTPINFELTADAPMNSFWIPRLGGQIYAMTGMSTKTHLIASSKGDYTGSAAEISGEGFSGMNFVVRASSRKDFDNWVNSAKNSEKILDQAMYNELSKPSENNPVTFYSSTDSNLYTNIMTKLLKPTQGEVIKKE